MLTAWKNFFPSLNGMIDDPFVKAGELQPDLRAYIEKD